MNIGLSGKFNSLRPLAAPCALVILAAGLACNANAADILLSASGFAVLAGSTVTNTGPTVITGDVGVSPGTAITGFPPGTVVGSIDSNTTAAIQAEVDLGSAYTYLSGLTATSNLTGQDLGTVGTLTAGVYKFNSSAALTGTLTLNGPGMFVFQIGSTLTTASAASILTTGGADASNVYFQVGSSATLGTSGTLQGNIVALTSITLNTGATLTGRALAENGAVTLDTNTITAPLTPEPGTVFLFGTAMSAFLALVSFRRKTGSRQG